jgi:hypothetical protein
MAKKRDTGPYEAKMHLDMPFDEALERFSGVDPREMHANIARAKKRKPPGEKPQPPGGSLQNVAKLSTKRIRKRNTGK